MNIPYFRYDFLYREFKADVSKAIQNVLNQRTFIMQKALADFEKTIAEFTGFKHAIGVGNGTDLLAIYIY